MPETGCDEHWGTRDSFSSGVLGVHAQQWDSWVVWQFYFQFFKESPTLCDPIDGSPPGSPVPGILQARILEWVAISFSSGSSRWRTVWRFLKKLKIELPYDPAIPLLGIHTEETKIERDTCTPAILATSCEDLTHWKRL